MAQQNRNTLWRSHRRASSRWQPLSPTRSIAFPTDPNADNSEPYIHTSIGQARAKIAFHYQTRVRERWSAVRRHRSQNRIRVGYFLSAQPGRSQKIERLIELNRQK